MPLVQEFGRWAASSQQGLLGIQVTRVFRRIPINKPGRPSKTGIHPHPVECALMCRLAYSCRTPITRQLFEIRVEQRCVDSREADIGLYSVTN
jgi:hypothetical protein